MKGGKGKKKKRSGKNQTRWDDAKLTIEKKKKKL